jgi:hypothetical protein
MPNHEAIIAARLDALPPLVPQLLAAQQDYDRAVAAASGPKAQEQRQDAAADLLIIAGQLLQDAIGGPFQWDWEHTTIWKGYHTYAPDADWDAITPPEPISDDLTYQPRNPPTAINTLRAIATGASNSALYRAVSADL